MAVNTPSRFYDLSAWTPGADGAVRGFDMPGAQIAAPSVLPPVTPFAGWKNVTLPVNPTGTGVRYDIGGGNNYGTTLAEVPWQSLQPGDVVNIWHNVLDYREKPLISETGTAAHPIIINGVSDAIGNRPVINGENAVSLAFSEREYYDGDHPGENAFEQAVVLFHRRNNDGAGGVFGQTADHIIFQNIHVKNADDTMDYTVDGVTHTYLDYARAVWVMCNEYVTIQGCVIENGQEGIFAGAPAEKPCKTITVRGNRFINNGFYAAFAAHQVYIVAYCEPDEYNIVEGNFFDSISDPTVAQCKVRSTGAVIRHNTVKASARMIDLVEAQDTVVELMYARYTAQQIIDKYRTSYIYGNLLVNDDSLEAAIADWIVHASWDTEEFFSVGGPLALGQPTSRGVHGGATYFFNNTVHRDTTHNDIPSQGWRGGLFDVDGAGVTTDEARVVSANNVISLEGGTLQAYMRYTGRLDWEAANLLFLDGKPFIAESDGYANTMNSGDDPAVLVNHNDTRLSGDPQFEDSANADFLLRDYSLATGSPALRAARALPAALQGVRVECNAVDPETGIMSARSHALDLGAVESSAPLGSGDLATVLGSPSTLLGSVLHLHTGDAPQSGDAVVFSALTSPGGLGLEVLPSGEWVLDSAPSQTESASVQVVQSDGTAGTPGTIEFRTTLEDIKMGFQFNIGKGEAAAYQRRVANNDPATSGLVLVMLQANEAQATMVERATLAEILANAENTEADFTNYARIVLTDAEVPAPTIDTANDRKLCDIPDQTIALAGNLTPGAGNNDLTACLMCYAPDVGGADSTFIPLGFSDFLITTNGNDLVVRVNAAGWLAAT